MDVVEQVARAICESRGADPDQSITIGRPDGEVASFGRAWEGYADLASAIVLMVRSP